MKTILCGATTGGGGGSGGVGAPGVTTGCGFLHVADAWVTKPKKPKSRRSEQSASSEATATQRRVSTARQPAQAPTALRAARVYRARGAIHSRTLPARARDHRREQLLRRRDPERTCGCADRCVRRTPTQVVDPEQRALQRDRHVLEFARRTREGCSRSPGSARPIQNAHAAAATRVRSEKRETEQEQRAGRC